MTKRNPPSRTTIRGQRHLLAYITPAEAELLKSRGGTGEFHKGVPSYPPGFGNGSSGFGSERSGGAAGGSSGASGSGRGGGPSGGRGGGRSSAGMGSSRDEGGRGYSGPNRGGAEQRPGSNTPQGKKNKAQQQINKQIALGKKNIDNMTTSDKIIAAAIPFAGLNVAQNYAAQFMGTRMKDVLSKAGSRAVFDSRTGRVSGVYDSLGRLTGRDPAAEAREEREKMNEGGGGAPSSVIKPEEEEEEEKAKLGKKVIRSDLAKEIEAERLRRRKSGMTQLGTRTLLSTSSRLGA